MKKLYIIITLFVSSFFLFNSDVKATTYYSTLDFSLINDDFFLFKSKVDFYVSDNSNLDGNYVIFYDNGYYAVAYTSSSTHNFSATNSALSFSSFSSYLLSLDNGVISSVYNQYYYSFNVIPSRGSNLYLLYSNFDIPFSHTIVFSYADSTFNIPSDSLKFPSLYGIYEEKFVPVDPHFEEKEKISNFYTLCIEKLSYLVTSIVSNYIYLSIFGIFILIIIFELIKRRFL